MEAPVGMAEAVEEMRVGERQSHVVAALLANRGGIGQAGSSERLLDDLPLRHLEAGMAGAQALGERADDEMIGSRLGIRLDHLARDLQVRVAARDIDVVVLEEGRRRQHDVGHGGGLGQELLVHAQEEIVARHAGPHLRRLGRNHHGIGVLDQHRRDRRAVAEIAPVAREDRPDARLVEDAHAAVAHVEALDERAVEHVEQAGLCVERAAALVLPGAGDGGEATCGEKLRRAVAAPGKAIAEAQEAPLGAAVKPREGNDLFGRNAGDRRRPRRIAAS